MKTRLFFCLLALCLSAGVASADPLTTRAQSRLHKLGYPPGPIDGLMGPKTRSALEYFQGDHDLARTRRLDEQTLAVLRLSGQRHEAPVPVTRLQSYLQDEGYYSGKVDGLIGRQTWRAMQAFLHDLGYYQGKIDGIAGPITRRAIGQWQAALQVEQTQMLDAKTVAALLGYQLGSN